MARRHGETDGMVVRRAAKRLAATMETIMQLLISWLWLTRPGAADTYHTASECAGGSREDKKFTARRHGEEDGMARNLHLAGRRAATMETIMRLLISWLWLTRPGAADTYHTASECAEPHVYELIVFTGETLRIILPSEFMEFGGIPSEINVSRGLF
ncbi:hypothetical protein J6590_027087 [Homalodisca vitripennis]|nr:hypothetical protein J6590_027087 [Homalodisca vitripennis]